VAAKRFSRVIFWVGGDAIFQQGPSLYFFVRGVKNFGSFSPALRKFFSVLPRRHFSADYLSASRFAFIHGMTALFLGSARCVSKIPVTTPSLFLP